MRKYRITSWTLIAFSVALSGFKPNAEQLVLSSHEAPDIENHIAHWAEPVKISIANALVVQGNKGQKNVEVMVLLSKASAEPVTVNYNTRDKSAKAGVDYIATSGSIKFEPGEVSRRIEVSIIGQVAADPDEDAPVQGDIEFRINLNGAVGAIIERSEAIITVLKNLSRGGVKSVYEVAFVYNGYVSEGASAQECGANTNGIVVLSGLLEGIEQVDTSDDVIYTGKLQMIMSMDLCTAAGNGDGMGKHCALRVAGSGTVEVELEIYFGTDREGNFDGRGGYIKIEDKDGQFMRSVTGCDAERIDDEKAKVPNESMTSIFNGYELPMLRTRTLTPGVYSVTSPEGNKTTVNVVRKIR